MTSTDELNGAKYNPFVDHLVAFQRQFPVERCYAAMNLAEERSACLSLHADGKLYNPRFAYPRVASDALARCDELAQHMPRDDNVWAGLIRSQVEQERSLLRAAQMRTPSAITCATTALFGEPTENLLRDALDVLAVTDVGEPPGTDVSAAEAARRMSALLREMNIDGWHVRVDEQMSARMSVSSAEHLVRVRRDARFDARELHRLAVHELGTHVLRAYNGSKQPSRLLAHGLGSYLATEEGLAVWNEIHFRATSPGELRLYAARVLAVHLSLRGSFATAFQQISQYLDPSVSFDICARAKRGLVDTSIPGAYVKDIVYLAGYRDVDATLQEDHYLYDALIAGKVSLTFAFDVRKLINEGHLLRPSIDSRRLGAVFASVLR